MQSATLGSRQRGGVWMWSGTDLVCRFPEMFQPRIESRNFQSALLLLLPAMLSLEFLHGSCIGGWSGGCSGCECTCSWRSAEHTSELQSLMSSSYAVFSFTNKNCTHKPTEDKK